MVELDLTGKDTNFKKAITPIVRALVAIKVLAFGSF